MNHWETKARTLKPSHVEKKQHFFGIGTGKIGMWTKELYVHNSECLLCVNSIQTFAKKNI